MAELYANEAPKKVYFDRHTYESLEEQLECMKKATTLYVGNLSFYTTEWQIHELFSTVGQVRRIIMGLDRFKKTPCGFCFVEFENHQQAQYGANFISGTKLDDRIIRCELDGGFKEGRQYGRGSSGGQVRDDRRSAHEYDAGRGGYGKYDGFSNKPFRRRTASTSTPPPPSSPGKEKASSSPKEEENPRFKMDDDEEKEEEDENPRFKMDDEEGTPP